VNNKEKKEGLILIALAKVFSEQATILTGTHRHKAKQAFNQAITATDYFIKTIEEQMNEEQKEYLQSLGDIYHNINIEIRRSELA
jgi:hypothetical protein